MTGRPLLKAEDVPENIKPLEMAPVGNYAIGITWGDGHKSLYPYKAILEEEVKAWINNNKGWFYLERKVNLMYVYLKNGGEIYVFFFVGGKRKRGGGFRTCLLDLCSYL